MVREGSIFWDRGCGTGYIPGECRPCRRDRTAAVLALDAGLKRAYKDWRRKHGFPRFPPSRVKELYLEEIISDSNKMSIKTGRGQ